MQADKGGTIEGDPLALSDHGLLPFQTEPVEILPHSRDELWSAAGGIEVVIAQEQSARGGPGALLGGPEGAGVAKVQQARGRGGQPAAIGFCGKRNHG